VAYFNHAFQKTFVGTSGFAQGGEATNELALGEFGLYDPKTWAQLERPSGCCPVVLVSGSIHKGKDKIGPYHGGYAESVKSKTINPKYVSAFYRVDPCPAQQAQIVVGATVDGFEGSCAKQFLCGETYSLRLDIKGSPVLRYLTRNTYYTSGAYTGCCAEDAIAPTPVNPLIVYTKWAYDFLNSPLISPFIHVAITYSTDGGANWNAFEPVYSDDSTTAEALLPYTLEGAAFPPGTDENTLAGLIITGAYADTRFQNCTFYPNDSIIAFLEPVKVYASEVDLNGDPCAFTGLCKNNICEPNQIKGTGENVIRDLILTEGYMQQPFYTGTDLRIREITNGTDVYDAIDRFSSYTRYYLQHSVPRFNNPTGTFDNDQYLLEIVGLATVNTVAVGNNVAAVFTVEDSTGIVPGMVVYVNGVVDATKTVLTVVGNTITMTGTVVVADGNPLFFIEESLYNFETLVSTWISECQGCDVFQAYTCPAICTEVPVQYEAPIL
jgi:hypothetical protein